MIMCTACACRVPCEFWTYDTHVSWLKFPSDAWIQRQIKLKDVAGLGSRSAGVKSQQQMFEEMQYSGLIMLDIAFPELQYS